MAGMVSAMLASAEPSARLRLVCRRLALAARSAAMPSGSSTMVAMTTPTRPRGAPMRSMPLSSAGVRNFASSTTQVSAISSRTALKAVAPAVGFGKCAWPSSPSSSAGMKLSRWRTVWMKTKEK